MRELAKFLSSLLREGGSSGICLMTNYVLVTFQKNKNTLKPVPCLDNYSANKILIVLRQRWIQTVSTQ